jgi:tetratricopeptide (TPR) repeat protein
VRLSLEGDATALRRGKRRADHLQRLARDLGITIARSARASALSDDRALTEAELFYQGLELEKRGETDNAIERYRQALEIDPNDGEARARLRKLLIGSH